MNLDIFESTRNWQYTPDDQLAELRFQNIIDEVLSSVPKGHYYKDPLSHFPELRKTKFYELLRTIPKGVMHNNHLNCNEDLEFFRDYVAYDPSVYFTADWTSFRIGTKEQATKLKWISMEEARKQFENEDDFLKGILAISTFTKTELKKENMKQREIWQLLINKMKNLQALIFSIKFFKKYIKHVFLKYLKNGYERLEFRAYLTKLKEFDQHGQFVCKHSETKYMEIVDEVCSQIKKDHPNFTVGFIWFGYKSVSVEENESYFTRICEYNWSKTIGFDFVQEEDRYNNLTVYDEIVTRVLSKFPKLSYQRVYHAGETNSHLSRNIDIAVLAGSVRIGHGLNIIQRVEFLPYCKHICFEKCPISNLVLGYKSDPRGSSAPILLGLGYAVSISPGDAGKFGIIDSTQDYMIAALSYNWTLKHLKLIAYHSINHALCLSSVRKHTLANFNANWNAWVSNFLKGQHQPIHVYDKLLDIFTNAKNWRYTSNDKLAEAKFQIIHNEAINHLPDDFYHKYTLTHLKHIRSSPLYEILKDLPKGVLHHDHFDCNEDEDFYREHIITDPNVYLGADRKCFKIGTKQEAEKNHWVSFAEARKDFHDERQFVKFVSNITMLSKEELLETSCNQKAFWDLFEAKITNFFAIYYAVHIFKKYTRHVLLKYINNGYNRLQFRALLVQLSEYDENGKLVQVHSEKKFMDLFDEEYNEVRKTYPEFSAGFIFMGLKALPAEINFNMLDKVCSYEWPNTIGIDFVQQEDPYGSIQPYIQVGDRVLRKYSHLNIKKVYHAGQTNDHLNNNVELAVKSGSVRIGHGLNIVRRIQFLTHCKHVCFQLNPISNLLTGGMEDIRLSTAPLLLGMGYSVSISSDDPGKFGYEDTTVDYFASAVSFNWSFKHLKLIAYHSINHAIVNEGARLNLLDSFNNNWDAWVSKFIAKEYVNGQI